jgi:radical SAM superfamily enzyme YgiQ (UPF0313 family)
MVRTRSAHATTATIIPFPGTPARDADPDTVELLRRAWRAAEKLTCALPSSMHPEQAKDADDLASFVVVLEQAALAAELTFKLG